jgi:hypothetical protein
VRLRAFGVVVGPLIFLLATAPVFAQMPPLPASQPFVGFVSPYEIVHRVRTAGFDPLAPPLREGTTYVVRAVDFRGVLMRVVLDARTGVIRDVAPIVPGPGRYGQYAYGGPPPYDPADFDAPMANLPAEADMEPPAVRPVPPAAMGRTALRPTVLEPTAPPLPRPRPAALASRKPDIGVDPNPVGSTGVQPPSTSPNGASPAAAQSPKSRDAASTKSGINSEIITAAPPPASAAPKKSPGDPPIDN